MSQQDDGFLEELRAMFKIEAEEHIKSITSGLLKLEKTDNPEKKSEIFEVIFRDAHSLKGASRAVNLLDVETLCQSLESVFALIKRDELIPTIEVFDILHETVDGVESLVEGSKLNNFSEILGKLNKLENKKTSKPPGNTEKKVGKEEIVSAPKELTPIKPVAASKVKLQPEVQNEAETPKVEFADTIRLPVSRLDSILLQAEDMLSARLAADQYVLDLKGLLLTLAHWRSNLEKDEYKEEVIDFDSDDNVEQEVMLAHIDQIKFMERRISEMSKIAENNSRQLSGMVNNLLEDMKQILMLPFSNLLKIMPKIVRDLSRDQGKEVQLISRGSTIEVDRRILEGMKDPFIHLFRNCIDHGLETPADRERLGKSRTGTVSVIVTQRSGDKVQIEVKDDGKGINADLMRKTAIERGIITAAAAAGMSDSEAVELIFMSDFSTSKIITDISGRGLGMAIVREKVEKLGGKLWIKTTPGKGTCFTMVLPVTVATFRGILVDVNDQVFVIPTHLVERTIRVKPAEVKTVENRETILADGQPLSLVRLADVLELPDSNKFENEQYLQVLIVNANNERIAFLVDEVQKEQEVLVKKLGKQLLRVRNVSGATVLGDGRVVPILNAADLVKSANQINLSLNKRIGTQEGKVAQKSILIAEDSITSRTLIKNILTTAGYKVKATVDGMDAFTALKSEDYDLVVSDVEMPRMSGFELVAKIRETKKHEELPVVLVTGLETREDRERGIDAGANAYIVKRGFDQSNLLEVINRLI